MSLDSDLAEALKTNDFAERIKQLDQFYGQVKRQLLRHQSPTSGLFPRVSCDTTEAHIRDSLYICCAVWSLFQAYSKRIDDDRGKGHELGQSAVKCMRGILFVWMRQSKDKVEPFKTNQSPKHALHSKVNLNTGLSLNDNTYGHLQIDVVSLYLLFLVQMITSGLQIIYTMDEVQFVQNLVYYVERAYRTPDFGMWERGNKYNSGTPEINASSIGLAKSALEAINGCNLFGEKGASWSVIYVDIDAHSRNRSIFETLLPRESSSKNTDASLLPTISWPAFATHDTLLYANTKEKIIKLLKTPYGFKRFISDGYGTVLEKREKLYQSDETKRFENIECDWPLFCCFMAIDGIFKNNEQQTKYYKDLLFNKLCRIDMATGDYLIPKYYYVPPEYVDAEKADPGSTPRLASQEGSDSSCLYLMGQAVLIITQLLSDGLLQPVELDPIRRFMPSYDRTQKIGRYSVFQGTASDLVVQVVLITESMRLQAMMATYGIQTQTPLEVEPVQIWPPSQLVKIYELLGINKKLGLKGRPSRPIGALGTSKLYRIAGQTVLCYPLTFELSDFYLSHDMALLIDDIKNELHFVGKYWRMSGRPTVCILIREEHLRDIHFKEMLDLLVEFKKGYLQSGLKIKTGRLQNLISSSCFEHLDFLHLFPYESLPKLESFRQLEHTMGIGYQSLTDIPKALVYSEVMDVDVKAQYQHRPTWPDIMDALKCCDTLYAQSQLLGILAHREGLQFNLPEGSSVRDRLERLLRQAGALRHWSVVRYCSSLLQKLVDSISPYITSILVSGRQITVGTYGHPEVAIDHPRTPREIRELLYSVIAEHYDVVLQQEIIVYVGRLISTTPHLFDGIIKVRVGSFVEAMKHYLSFKHEETRLEALSPSQLRRVLYKVLTDNDLKPKERRLIEGSLGRVPKHFYDKVWDVLGRTAQGLRVGSQHMESKTIIKMMSQNELNFITKVENFLCHISASEYRQLIVELLIIIHVILERNPELEFKDASPVDLDMLIKGGVDRYNVDLEEMVGIEEFYCEDKSLTSAYMARAILDNLLHTSAPECKIS